MLWDDIKISILSWHHEKIYIDLQLISGIFTGTDVPHGIQCNLRQSDWDCLVSTASASPRQGNILYYVKGMVEVVPILVKWLYFKTYREVFE